MFIQYPDPRLAVKAEPAKVDAKLKAIGERLVAANAEAVAYGLAAALPPGLQATSCVVPAPLRHGMRG